MANEKKTPARIIAFCGVCCALALVFMLMGSLPFAAYCAPMLASVVLMPVLVEQGERMAWLAYAAIALLSLILCGEKDAALVFLFLGYYPIVKFRHMEFVRSRAARVGLKLLLFNAAVCVMYGILFLTMGGEALMREMVENGWFLTALMLVMGNAAMLLYDWMLERLLMTYMARRPGAKKR